LKTTATTERSSTGKPFTNVILTNKAIRVIIWGWGQFLTTCLPPGVKFGPRGKHGTQGWHLSPRGNVHPFIHPLGWTLFIYCLEEWRGEQRNSPLGDNFIPRNKVHSWGSKFAPRVEVKNGPLVRKTFIP
jgi:hypothetical protein